MGDDDKVTIKTVKSYPRAIIIGHLYVIKWHNVYAKNYNFSELAKYWFLPVVKSSTEYLLGENDSITKTVINIRICTWYSNLIYFVA